MINEFMNGMLKAFFLVCVWSSKGSFLDGVRSRGPQLYTGPGDSIPPPGDEQRSNRVFVAQSLLAVSKFQIILEVGLAQQQIHRWMCRWQIQST